MHGFNPAEGPGKIHLTENSGEEFEFSVWENKELNDLKQWNADLDTQEVVIANQLKKRKIRQNPTEARKIHLTETSGKRLNSASGELESLIMTETMDAN